LSEEVVRTPVPSKWAVPATILVAVGLVAFAAGRPEDPKPPAIKPVPADAPPTGGRLLLLREDGFTVLSPDGKKLLAGKAGPRDADSGWAWLSPDGKRVAYLISFGDSERQPRVMVRDLDGGKFATSIDVNAMHLLWAPDGRSLVATSYLEEKWSPLKTEHVRIDLVARTVSKLAWPDDVFPVDWSADGKSVVVVREGKTRPTGHLGLMTADGKQVTELTALRDANVWSGAGRRLSPDGKKLLYADAPPEGPDRHGMTRRLYVMDLETKKATEVAGVPLNATVHFACWSPDGKRIAYTWRQRHGERVEEWAKKQVLEHADVAVETEMFLIVADADGSNAKTIASAKTNNALEVPLRASDWR
jgi:Tol biopolymer transport system component